MTLPAVVERRRRTASLVLRPVDALREALKRPPHERGPLGQVRLRLAGRVEGGQVRPLPRGSVRTVRNLSGDTVFVDLGLPAGTYRLEVERDARDPRNAFYEELDPLQRDLRWDPDTPSPGLPDGRPHVSKLVPVLLRPSPAYPFPQGSTLVRGTLLWYDGAPLAGAVVGEPAALVRESRADPHGGFVLAFPAASATGPAALQLDTGGADAAGKPSGAAYLAGWPSVWAAQWRRGAAVAMRQAALTGRVLGPGGRPLPGAAVTLVGRPGAVVADGDGRWQYRFPPATAAGTVDLVVQHPGHAAVRLASVPFAADATSQAPVVRMR